MRTYIYIYTHINLKKKVLRCHSSRLHQFFSQPIFFIEAKSITLFFLHTWLAEIDATVPPAWRILTLPVFDYRTWVVSTNPSEKYEEKLEIFPK